MQQIVEFELRHLCPCGSGKTKQGKRCDSAAHGKNPSQIEKIGEEVLHYCT
jgi:hypothetical protein